MGFFTKLFYTLIYNIFIAWPKVLIEATERIVFKLSSSELLDYVLLGGNENKLGMPPLLFYLSIIAGILIIVLIIGNFIAACLSLESVTMKQKLVQSFKNGFKGAGVIIIIPLLFLVFNFIIGIFQNLLVYGTNKFNNPDTNKGTITQMIHDMGWIGQGKGIPGWSDFEGNYNPIIVVFGLVFFFINLFKLGMILIMRLFEIIMLYMLSVGVASKMTIDGGGALVRWKELVVSKFLMALGIVLAVAVTFTTINLLSNAVDNNQFNFITNLSVEKVALKLFIVLAGTTFMLFAHQYIAMITGGETALVQGQIFGQQMGQIWQGFKGAGYTTGKILGFAHKQTNEKMKTNPFSASSKQSSKEDSIWRQGVANRTGLAGVIGKGLIGASLAKANYKNNFSKFEEDKIRAPKIKAVFKTAFVNPIENIKQKIEDKKKNVEEEIKQEQFERRKRKLNKFFYIVDMNISVKI